jgi:transcriptional regulator with XRE-family HTH domain
MARQGTRERLRQERLGRGWSLEDAAVAIRELGLENGLKGLAVSGVMVGRWERGEVRPRAPYPKLLCLVYGQDGRPARADELLALTHTPSATQSRDRRCGERSGGPPGLSARGRS